jgi:hypothetical protein
MHTLGHTLVRSNTICCDIAPNFTAHADVLSGTAACQQGDGSDEDGDELEEALEEEEALVAAAGDALPPLARCVGIDAFLPAWQVRLRTIAHECKALVSVVHALLSLHTRCHANLSTVRSHTTSSAHRVWQVAGGAGGVHTGAAAAPQDRRHAQRHHGLRSRADAMPAQPDGAVRGAAGAGGTA